MALFFDSLRNNQTTTMDPSSGIQQLDSAMQGVENKINMVNDQISSLGSSTQLEPLINSFRELSDYINRLKTSDISEIDKNFSNALNSASQLVNVLNSTNSQGLTGIKDSIVDIDKTLQNINNVSSINQLISNMDKLEQSLLSVAQRSNEFNNSMSNLDVNSLNITDTMQNNMRSLDDFLISCPTKVNEIKSLFSQIATIDENNLNEELTSVINNINQKMTSLANDINDNVKIGETLSDQFREGGDAANDFLNILSSIVGRMNTTLNDVSFDRLNGQLRMTIDNFGELNQTSFANVNQDLSALDNILDKLQQNFSRMSENIGNNNNSLASLSQIINELNHGDNTITFDSNITQIIREAENAKTALSNVSHVDPNFAVEQFEKIKNANDEMQKIKEQMMGLSMSGTSGALSNEMFQTSKGPDGLFSSEYLNNNILIESATQLKDSLAQYGATYQSVVESLSGQIVDLQAQQSQLSLLNTQAKQQSFNGLLQSLGNSEDEYTQMDNFQLLGRSVSGRNVNGTNFLSSDINKIGNSAVDLEQNIKQYRRKQDSEYYGITEKDKKNVEAAFGGQSIDTVIDQAQGLQRLVLEFNKNKNDILKTVNKAISTGTKDDIENAKADMQSLMDFATTLMTQSNILGDNITVKSLKQFETLPKEVQSIIKDIEGLVGVTKNVGYNTEDLAEAFGLNVNQVRELNKELEKTDVSISSTTANASTLGSVLSSGLSSASKMMRSVSRIGGAIGISGLSLGSVLNNTSNYYKDRGMMAVDSYRADISLGTQFSPEAAFDRNYNQALKYYDASNGLINFNEYNSAYTGLVKNVGARNGISSEQAAVDLSIINDETFALSKVYGISDSTIQQATKTFYQDFGMSAKETSNMINEMVQVAKSANIPIEKYVSQMSSLAENYKNVGLSGRDAQNVMSNMLLSGMNIDMAASFTQGVGGAVNTFGNNKSLNAYFGVLSGQYSSPFEAIRGGLDKYDENGNLRADYGQRMAATMDTALATYGRLGGGNSNQQWNITYDMFKNQYGMDDKNASIATNKYINNREGFADWMQEYESKGGENSIEIETQNELIGKIADMSSQLAETQKIESELKEGAYALTTTAQALGDNYLAPLRVQIDQLIQSLAGVSQSIAGGLTNIAQFAGNHGNELLLGGSALAGTYAGYKGLKAINGVSNFFGGSRGAARAAGAVDAVSEVAEHSDDIARVGSNIPWAKVGKLGLVGLIGGGIGYGAYKLGSGLFDGSSSSQTLSMPNYSYMGSTGYSPEYQQYLAQNYSGSGYNASGNGQYIDYESMISGYYGLNGTNSSNQSYSADSAYALAYMLSGNGTIDNRTEEQKLYSSLSTYGSMGSGKENILLSLGVGGASAGGDALVSAALKNNIGNFANLGKVAKFGSYGVGDIIGGMAGVGQHVIQGDYVDGDIQGHMSTAGINATGSIAGAAIGSLAGPIGTVIGGVLGSFTTDLLDLIKLGNGKGLGTTMSDTIAVAFGGSTSEELEYKRAIINNPKELLENRNAMLGISQEQSEEIDGTMQTHSKELSHLTEEQKTAMKTLCVQLNNLGLDMESSFKEVATLFSKENVESTMKNLDQTIKDAIKNAELPKGWTEQDLKDVSGYKDEKYKAAQNDLLNSSDYVSQKLMENGISEQEAKALSLYGEKGWQSAYSNPNDKYHNIAVSLIDDWLSSDAEKTATKQTAKYVDQKEDEKKKQAYAVQKAAEQKKADIEGVVDDQIYGGDDSLFITYLQQGIKNYNTTMQNRVAAGKGEGDEEYDDAKYMSGRFQAYIDYAANKEKLTAQAKANFKDGNRTLKTGWFGSDKTYKNENDYINDYLEQQGAIDPTADLFANNWREQASKDITYAIESGNGDVYGQENKQIKKLIDDTKSNAEDSKKQNDSIIDNGTKTTKSLAEANIMAAAMGTTMGLMEKSLGSIDTTLKGIQVAGSNGAITTLEGLANAGGNGGTFPTSSLSTQSLDTSTMVRNYNSHEGQKLKSSDVSIINSLFKGTVLENEASTIADKATKYGVDPMLMASIMQLETGGDSSLLLDHNNVGGIKNSSKGKKYNAGDFAGYDSLDQGIDDLARILKEVYYNNGKTTIQQIGDTYAPSSDGNVNWAGKVSSIYYGLNTGAPGVSNYIPSTSGSDASTGFTGAAGGTTVGDAMVQIARSQIGKPYLWGAEGSIDWDNDKDTRDGYDCSGLVGYASAMAGMNIGRLTANDLYKKCTKISKGELQKGDLGFNVSGGKATHVGIYSGENTWIHAPQTGDYVKEVGNVGFNEFGRLPGVNGTSTADLTQYPTGTYSGGSASAYGSATSQIESAGLFAQGSMLYGIVPSDYASNFSNDSNQRSNYAKMVTDLMAGGGTPGTSLYSQNESRMARVMWDQTSGYERNNIYKDTIDSIGKNTTSNRKDYNINVKLDTSNSGDSKVEKEIKAILNDTRKKLEDLGLSVENLENGMNLLDETLYNERG